VYCSHVCLLAGCCPPDQPQATQEEVEAYRRRQLHASDPLLAMRKLEREQGDD
jgi:hypothetical protein